MIPWPLTTCRNWKLFDHFADQELFDRYFKKRPALFETKSLHTK